MKKTLLSLLLHLQFVSFAQISPIRIIPEPIEITMHYGAFDLTKSTTIGYDNQKSKPIADLLIQKLNAPTGFNLNAQFGTTNQIQLNIRSIPNPNLGKEGYTLETTSDGVVISANETAGLFYGCQTLLQLFPKEIASKTSVKKDNWRIPAVSCTDYPRFAWRGTMLDVSRHFFSKADVKTYIDELASYKYNTFHWHLTDDEGWRIEIKSLPKLTEIGACRVQRYGRFGSMEPPKEGEKATDCGFYTHEDIKEIVKYAQERYVTIVPEIDVPGHSLAAIAAYPELSCKKDPNTKVNPGMAGFSDWYGNGTFKMNIENALDPSEEKVYDFLDKVFTEITALFPNPYIHVGGDECYKGYWKEDESCQSLMKKLNTHHVEGLQGYFMGRVEKILASKGKKLIGWDEILEGGISPNATVMSWRGIKGGIEAAESGHEAVMTPTTFTYIDYNQGEKTVDPPIYAGLRVSKSYSYEPVPEGVDPKYILGGQGNLWTEHITTLRYAEYMTYPRAWALSEVFWSAKSKKDWEKFVPKMEAHFERADLAEINYSKAVFDPIVKTSRKNGQLILEMGSEIAGIDIYYTIDDAMPDRYCTHYTQPVALPDGPTVLRVVAYRKGQPIGHLITLDRKKLEDRAE
jgi:hexosaminidase